MENVEDKASVFQQQIICLPREPIPESPSSALDSTSLGTKDLFVENGRQESLDTDQHTPADVPEVNAALSDPSLLSFLLVPSTHQDESSEDTSNELSQTSAHPSIDDLASPGALGETPATYDHTRKPRKSYPVEFKLKAIEYFRSGHTRAATAKVFSVHRKRIQEWINQEFRIKGCPVGRRRLTRRLMEKIKIDVSSAKVSNQMLADCSGVGVSSATVCPACSFTPAETLTDAHAHALPSNSRSNTVTAHALTLPSNRTLQGLASVEHLDANSSVSSTKIVNSQFLQPNSVPQLSDSSTESSVSTTKRQNLFFLQSLGEEAVLKILEAMNLSKYKASFLQEQVDGELLASLSEVELKELGVDSSLHRLRLLKLISGSYSAEQLLKSSMSLY